MTQPFLNIILYVLKEKHRTNIIFRGNRTMTREKERRDREKKEKARQKREERGKEKKRGRILA